MNEAFLQTSLHPFTFDQNVATNIGISNNFTTMEHKLLTTAIHFLFILTLGKVFAFNLDMNSAVIYEGPVQSDLFGYAVATHSYNGQKW